MSGVRCQVLGFKFLPSILISIENNPLILIIRILTMEFLFGVLTANAIEPLTHYSLLITRYSLLNVIVS